MGGLVVGIAVAAFSGDWACSAIGLGVVGAVVTGLLVRLLRYLGPRSHRWVALLPLWVVVMAGGFAGWLRWDLRHRAFREALGVEMPAAIQELAVKRYYAGGPGDSLLLMRFRATPEIVALLTSNLATSSADGRLEEFRAGQLSTSALWHGLFSEAEQFSQKWQASSNPLQDPVLFQSVKLDIRTTLLWDRATGNVYVMHTVG
jgi:hypothetical protein